MIVDHMDVAYTDTLAVGVLLYVLNSLEKNGGRLVLTGVNPQMKKIIYVSKLHTRLEIFDNLQDAETFAF